MPVRSPPTRATTIPWSSPWTRPPQPQFTVITDTEAARVQPAKHAIRHKDHSRGYFARAMPFLKHNGPHRQNR